MMRSRLSLLLLTAVMTSTASELLAEGLKPFVLASAAPGDFATAVQDTKLRLERAGFEILGEYSPYEKTFVDHAHVIVVTNSELKQAAQLTKYGAFAAPWRIAVTQAGGLNQVAYANPEYIAHAYRLKSDLAQVTASLRTYLGAHESFGSQDGKSKDALASYRYMMGMEQFDDVYQLAEYSSHAEAVAAVQNNLNTQVAGMSGVYRLDLNNQTTVFGVARKAPTSNEQYMDDQFIMSTVDFKTRKGTAYLPYEILVDGNKVVALHMRFRMAVHYPDLKMMGANSFMKLRPSPAAIEVALKQVAGGR
ncbi:hypothetical protein NG895_22965 [Aeoliella sp. ICT_H6.2]|uniref:Uncharacterized protein n=1 Tax=Aeoliella straminimaris TaxID=2954799 RepID=A0A9X2JKK7_9BACT|nr:hypothetical protein [Aeoliella straminimaris]MCO6046769.1 hypothetical protein [Aeoliella straminimaris]